MKTNHINRIVKLGILSSLALCVTAGASYAQQVPTPDHVVVVILENHSYSSIIGSSSAPYINSLATDSMGALFSQSFALTHPSQPNYIMLFSGSNQGVTDDNLPGNAPFSTDNLGAELIAKSKTFGAYSEDLPSVGYTGTTYNYYARKHDPWVNWIGASSHAIPSSDHMPFTSFPTNYSNLPTVSFVIPNLNDDMHNGNDPSRIVNSDNWIKNNLGNYVTWAKTHNSLLIVTFDEDDNSTVNQIATIFVGQMVKGATYSEHIDHYRVLRTIEDMYGLSYAGGAASSTPITDCWVASTTGINNISAHKTKALLVYPNPAQQKIHVQFHSQQAGQADVLIEDMLGRVAVKDTFDVKKGGNTLDVNTSGLADGTYFVVLKNGQQDLTKKITIQK